MTQYFPRLLNIGCGNAIHPEWINLDSSSAAPGVTRHDLRRGLPFADASVDAIFASHVLEHLDLVEGARLLRECHRVLRPGGTARMVVPDLEAIVKLYLESLKDAERGIVDAEFRYDWAMLELFDQAVRSASGGRMAVALRGALNEREVRFVEGRIGQEAMQTASQATPTRRGSLGLLLRRPGAALAILRARAAVAWGWILLGQEGATAIREGLFRRSGEVHLHMYDRFSLRRELERAGFVDIRVCAAGDSRIPDFPRYGFELRNSLPRKPDSLYLEGCKPGAA